ncbi:hypothetical protein Cgig2_014915 [Carnegiea gigantea]|uniref:Uncharacterized protein n=1 Tax=Carnegiea gigantea TaxID=171969 RepID=A0A9Q1GL34_9CARY|nr:hypothetical protein Cgig2_014915 [Carnegiea gigantea]
MTVGSCFSDACRRQAPSSIVSLHFYHHPPLLLPLPPLLLPLQLSPIIELGCIASDADEALFKHLAISLNLNLAGSELKQGKFLSIITICYLILEFVPYNTKALFRRPKAELGLHNVHKALCELREAARIEPNNAEIVKELAKVEKRDCHAEGCNKDVQDSEHYSRYLVNSACGGSPGNCKVWNIDEHK